MAWRLAPGVRWRLVGREAILLDLGASQYYTLDEVGTFAWERIERGEELAAVVTAVVAAFAVDEEVARRDLEDLLASLVASGLLLAP